MKTFFITHFSKDFKKFKDEYLNTPSEWFWRDGERILTDKELEYKKIIDRKKLYMNKSKNALLFLLIFWIGSLSFSQTGKVIGVKDGDTVVILDEKAKVQYTVRVADIDCPEKNQPFGKKAKWFTSSEIFGKEVKIQIKNPNKPTDKYDRIIGYVLYEGKNLSHELLKVGLAWHYKYYSNDQKMAKLEKIAINKKLGLWSEPNPINPHKWRKGKRN